MYLLEDHLSIWEISHRWHDYDPNLTDPTQLPLKVQDSIRSLAHGMNMEDFHLVDSFGHMYWNGRDLPKKNEYIPQKLLKTEIEEEIIGEGLTLETMKLIRMSYEEAGVTADEINEHVEYFDYCQSKLREHSDACEYLTESIKSRTYDKSKLEHYHLDKMEVLNFCIAKDFPPPSFWYTESELKHPPSIGVDFHVNEKKLRPSQMARTLCRAIANTLWNIYPQMNITEMCRHEAIKKYGNGGHYSGKAVRGWITDLDPRPPEEKKGRPPKQGT